jgi:hypothetical protein
MSNEPVNEPANEPVDNPSLTAPPANEPPPADPPASDPNPDNLPPDVESIYGKHVTVEWPEGMNDDLKNHVALKPFVNIEADKGKINTSSLLKAYVDTKKLVGAKGLQKPSEYAEKHEVDEFYKEAIGYEPDRENYKVDRPEEAKIPAEMYDKIADFAHENRVPAEVAAKFLGLLENSAVENMKNTTEASQRARVEELKALENEWGSAYKTKFGLAAKLVGEFGDESLVKFLDDSGENNNPHLIRIFSEVASKLYKTGNFPGKHDTEGSLAGMTPSEADTEINMIRGDKNHPFNNKNHPNHKKAGQDMLRLYEIKNSGKRA